MNVLTEVFLGLSVGCGIMFILAFFIHVFIPVVVFLIMEYLSCEENEEITEITDEKANS